MSNSCDPTDCSPPGSSAHGIFQVRVLEWDAIAFSKKRQRNQKKGRGTRDQIANIHWIIEKAREFQRNIYFCFIDYAKAFDYVDHNTGKF